MTWRWYHQTVPCGAGGSGGQAGALGVEAEAESSYPLSSSPSSSPSAAWPERSTIVRLIASTQSCASDGVAAARRYRRLGVRTENPVQLLLRSVWKNAWHKTRRTHARTPPTLWCQHSHI
jgi:hypothetical protein